MYRKRQEDIFSSLKCEPAPTKPNPLAMVYVIQEIAGTKDGRPKINIIHLFVLSHVS